MNRKITDDAVRRLPVHEGRAELLEEIMATTRLDSLDHDHDHDHPAPPSRRGRWLPALGAAAAVAALVAGVLWLGAQTAPEPREAPVAQSPGDGDPDPGRGDRAVLLADGWVVEHAVESGHGGELRYTKGDQTVDIHWRPADQYAAYVADRNAEGRPAKVDVLGDTSLMWAYSATDHTVIRPVEQRFTLEVRGTGMDEPAFRALLAELRLVGEKELERHLPESFVTDAERPEVIAAMAEPLPLPEGLRVADLTSQETQRYHLAADVTGAVACAWIGQYLDARAAGDDARAAEAQDALATAREWPVLKEIADEGGWSSALWEYADLVVGGRPDNDPKGGLSGYADGLGCSS